MKKKNIIVSILILLIFFLTIVYILFALQQKNITTSFQENILPQQQNILPEQETEEKQFLSQESFQPQSISGSIVEVIQGTDASDDMWIKVLSQQQNEEQEGETQKEYAFFLSGSLTQGDKEIQGGDVVNIFYQGELSQTEYTFVEKIEKIQ